MADRELPSHAHVVVIGGGVIGASVAYHLTRLGVQEVVVLERKKLTSGTTWHAAGLLTTLRDSESQTWLAKYTQDLYDRLEQETGQATGFLRCGSIQIAESPEKVREMRRGTALARVFGVENEEISAAQMKEMWPLADVSDVEAGFYFPKDGRANPTDVTQALMKGASQKGALLFEDTAVTGVLTQDGRAVGVETERGRILSEYVVNCGGMWGREIGKMAGVDVPLQAAEHYYLISEPIEGVHNMLPILRNPEKSAYAREEAGGKILLGFFEPVAATWGVDGIPDAFCFDELSPDWERMEPYIEKAMARIPALYDVGIRQFFCGPESFTPDHNYLMGEAPNLDNFFVAAGFNSLGILSGGGVGHVMAHWIVDGHPPMEVWDVDLQRMHPFRNNLAYLSDRIVESLGIAYQHHWPARQWETARNVKKSILHDRVAAVGACFGESAGWERPNWYAEAGESAEYEYGWGKTNWFHRSAEEHRAVREGVGVFEQTSFSKILVQGADALAGLNRLATADLDMPVGDLVYTQFLNERGGIEADVTISRMAEDAFLIVTPAFTHTHVDAWLRRHLPKEQRCVTTDVTTAYVMLNLQGPKSRDLLARLTRDPLDDSVFPFGTWRELEVGYQRLTAMRVSYTGELGFELYVPTEYALPVYDRLVEEGRAFDLKHCGYHALNSLRIEKGYREWAHDIGPEDTPLESGLAFTCAWDKPGGFIGRDALLEKRGKPLTRRLVQFLLEDPEPQLFHNEPILRDGELVGLTSSAGYGHTLGAAMALGYVRHDGGVDRAFLESGRFEIDVEHRRFAARASLRPMYDPRNERIRV